MSLFLNKEEAETQNKVSEILSGKSIQEIVEYINENRHNINVEKVLLTLVDSYQQDFVSSQIMLNEMQLALAYYAINGINDAILDYYGNSRFVDIAELYKSNDELDKNYSFGLGFNMSFSDYIKRCEEIEKTYESDLEKVRKMQEQGLLNQEKPKPTQTPKETIQAMFDYGHEWVLCLCKNNDGEIWTPDFINKIDGDIYCGRAGNYAQAIAYNQFQDMLIKHFDSRTGTMILESKYQS